MRVNIVAPGWIDTLFALSEVSSYAAIVDALKLKLLPEEEKAIESRGTDNIEAYDLYLRALPAYSGKPRSITDAKQIEDKKKPADDELAGSEAPLLEHLVELRKRLI